jgi:hypothetical protein
MLPAALFFLVSALLLPGSYPAASAKGGYFADQFASIASFQKDHLGEPEGDDQKFIPPTDRSTTLPPALFSALSPRPAPASDVPFTVNQARAPPLS